MIWYFLAGMIAGAVGMYKVLAAIGEHITIIEDDNNDKRTTGNQDDMD